MKTTKRIIAVALAVLMIALTIPFAVSAATTYTLTVQCEKPDYKYTVYKIADLDEETGAYKNFATTAIGNAIKQSTDSTADVLAAADAATTLTNGTELVFDATHTSRDVSSLTAGMYYIKCTGRSASNKSVAKNNIVPLPNKNMSASDTAYTVDVALNKITENGEPTITKKIKKADGTLVDELSVETDETITYVLTAEVTGTPDNKLAKYIIADDMDTENLSLADVNIESVQLVPASGTAKNLGYTEAAAGDLGSVKGLSYDFGVSINAEELEKDSFYTEGNTVVVTFTTKLTENAKLASAIPNADGLKYENKSGKSNEVKGNTVNVYTYKIKVVKVDADSTTTKLSGAKFKIYRNYDDATKTLSNEIEESAETDRNGEVTFNHKFAEGTYYVQESQAPTNYNLNTAVFEVKIEKGSSALSDGVYSNLQITDTKTKLPETGGAGTMVFTIVGASLIVAAGILLAVVLKKRSK